MTEQEKAAVRALCTTYRLYANICAKQDADPSHVALYANMLLDDQRTTGIDMISPDILRIAIHANSALARRAAS